MKQRKENIRATGKLYLNNKLFEENATLEFKDNINNNLIKKGRIEVRNLKGKFFYSFKSNKYRFRLTDKNKKIFFGWITELEHIQELYSNTSYLYFDLEKSHQLVRYKKSKINNLVINYRIPFVYLLGRGINYSYGHNDSFILKYSKPILTLNLNGIKINIGEFADAPSYNDQNVMIYREIGLNIFHKLKANDKLETLIDQYNNLMGLVIKFS